MKSIEVWSSQGEHETIEFTPDEVRSWPIGNTIEFDGKKYIVAIDYFCRKALYLAEAFPWMNGTNEQGRPMDSNFPGARAPSNIGNDEYDD